MLLLDEPTTALDLPSVRGARGAEGIERLAGPWWSTHDLNLVALCAEVLLKEGCVLAQGPTADLTADNIARCTTSKPTSASTARRSSHGCAACRR
jgi:ABC-type cobalamin/Fe3+-siderophores transport system ATPase subunit